MKDVFKWQYEKSIMPQQLLDVAFDFDRDVRKLWGLDLPVVMMPITELQWHLDMPFFWQKDKLFSLKPRDVLNNPVQYSHWIERIMQVDTSYPLDVILWNGNWQIIDGLHRLCKQIILGETTVAVRKLPRESIELIRPD